MLKFSRLSVIAFSLVAVVAGSSTGAWADESIMQIARNRQEKQIIINFLRERLNRHQRMTTEQIIAELNASAERNHKMLLDKQARDAAVGAKPQVPGDTAHNFEMLVTQETDKLRQLKDRDLILALEAARLQDAMTSENYMLYIMNHGAPQLTYLVCTCGDPTLSIIFAIFLVPFDIVALPIEFLLTAITGF